MEDNSPILLQLQPNEPEYAFYMQTILLYNLLVFPDGYNPAFINPDLLNKYKGFDFARYNNLVSKFAFADNQALISISLNETLLLLSAVDVIGNMLLNEAGESFRSMAAASFEVSYNWENIYLKSAQNLFANYRVRFAGIPRLVELIDSISLLNDENNG